MFLWRFHTPGRREVLEEQRIERKGQKQSSWAL